jgi:hypothetical protein
VPVKGPEKIVALTTPPEALVGFTWLRRSVVEPVNYSRASLVGPLESNTVAPADRFGWFRTGG